MKYLIILFLVVFSSLQAAADSSHVISKKPFDVQLQTDLDQDRAELKDLRQANSADPIDQKHITELTEQLPPEALGSFARRVKEGQTDDELIKILGNNYRGTPETDEIEWRKGTEGVSTNFTVKNLLNGACSI